MSFYLLYLRNRWFWAGKEALPFSTCGFCLWLFLPPPSLLHPDQKVRGKNKLKACQFLWGKDLVVAEITSHIPLIRFRKMIAISCNSLAWWPGKNFSVVTKGPSSVSALCRYSQKSQSYLVLVAQRKTFLRSYASRLWENTLQERIINILKMKPWVTPPHTMCYLMINDIHQDILADSLIWGRYTLLQLMKLSRNLL